MDITKYYYQQALYVEDPYLGLEDQIRWRRASVSGLLSTHFFVFNFYLYSFIYIYIYIYTLVVKRNCEKLMKS